MHTPTKNRQASTCRFFIHCECNGIPKVLTTAFGDVLTINGLKFFVKRGIIE